MKNLIELVLTSLLLGVLTLGSAQAQRTEVIKVNIPFDFTVASQNFPAGQYSLKRVEPGILELRDAEGRVLATALTHSVETSAGPARPKLLFDNQDGRHVLAQVWTEDDAIGQQIPQSKSAVVAVRKHSGHVQTAEVGNPR